MSLVLALLTSWIGYIVYPGTVVSQEFTLVHVWPGQSEVYVTTGALLLSPAQQNYFFETTAAAAYIDMGEVAGPEKPLAYALEAPYIPAHTQLYMDLWTKRRLLVERFAASPGFFAEPGEATDQGVAGQVSNRSSFDLQHCYRLTSRGVHRLPDIPAGHTLRLESQEDTVRVGSLQTRGQPELLARVLSRYRVTPATADSTARVVCAATGVVPGVTSPRHKVRHTGATVLVYHLTRQTRS
jgi:hypothetical protein